MTPFFGKRCFLTWLKKWVLLTVFLKSCVFLKTLFYSVFSKTQLFKNKNCMFKKNRKFMKNSGLFWNMAKWCFLGLFFEVLILLWFVFGVSGIVSKVLKMLVFSQFLGAFLGWLIVVHLGLEGLGVFVFLVFVFHFFCCFCFCFVCFVIGFVVGCCCYFFFVFLLLFFVFWRV